MSANGQRPSTNNVTLDGVRVPYLYHVGLGPSIVHPGMVERVDLYPGGFPARFGRHHGGAVPCILIRGQYIASTDKTRTTTATTSANARALFVRTMVSQTLRVEANGR